MRQSKAQTEEISDSDQAGSGAGGSTPNEFGGGDSVAAKSRSDLMEPPHRGLAVSSVPIKYIVS